MTIQLATQLVAYFLVFLSMWLYGKQGPWGPLVGALSCAPWIAMAVQSRTPSMVAFEVVMLGLEMRLLWIWTKKKSC